jgi:ribonuclease Z
MAKRLRGWFAVVALVGLLLSCQRGSGGERTTTTRPPPPAPSARTHRTELVMLGTGNPTADPDRSGPATAVVVDGVAYIFDCGPGVVRRAAAAARLHKLDALVPENIKFLFVTHLHSDHTLGYPDLMLSPWVLGRAFPLEVYGPPGIARMTEHLREAYGEDIALRSEAEDLASAERQANVHEVKAGLVYQDERVRITAFAVNHGTWKHAFSYRLEGPDRTIVITGDYGPPFDAIIAACAGCDVLVTEAYPTKLLNGPRAPYLRAFHVSAEQLGPLATKAGAKLVVHTHRRGDVSDEELRADIARGYAGPIVFANDLDRL